MSRRNRLNVPTAASAFTAAVLLFFVILPANPAHAVADDQPAGVCTIDSDRGLIGGATGIVVNGRCVSINAAQRASDQPQAQYRTVACLGDGSMQANGRLAPGDCGRNVPVCKRVVGGTDTGPAFIQALADQTRAAGAAGAAGWVTLSFWCPQHQNPAVAPTATDIRDRAIRLLPHVAAETTAPNTLVNIQTLLWAVTAVHRDLGRVTVLGQPVRIRLDFDHADWTFGDGHTDTTSTPGKVYDPAHDRCTTVNCPDYYGHTYRTTGPMTITVRVSWTATYSLDGQHYQPVANAPITGPAATVHILARQARAQLTTD